MRLDIGDALLGIGDVMVDQLLCGDIVPSRSFEKKLIEKLEIAPQQEVRRLTDCREKKSKGNLWRQEKTRRVA
jgi:hypothetical protein